ncbi:hypothetical protein LEP3755_34200 [Leptolyngbya sp. NIES-3755]|nr:hypothetical protein LEP3755_34200 [Leptolyngbya sp. NIES-3755]
MSTLIFPSDIKPLRPLNLTNSYRVRETKFANNYRQIAPIGLQNADQRVELEFIVQGDDIDLLLNFFNTAKGSEPFQFTLPHHEAAFWTHGPVSTTPIRDDLWRFKVAFTSFNNLANPIQPEQGGTNLAISDGYFLSISEDDFLKVA